MNALKRLEVIREETNSLFIDIYKEVDTSNFLKLIRFTKEIGSNINADTLIILGINLIKLGEFLDQSHFKTYSAWVDSNFTYIPEMDEMEPEYVSYRDFIVRKIA